jgi:Na+-transporting NADH:ubiquinone oxidoreductase subunit C
VPEETRNQTQGQARGSKAPNWFNKILALPNDSTRKTLFVALALCLACSILVSTAAVTLKPRQDANKALDRQMNILQVAGLLEPDKPIDELFEQVEARVVDLATGEYVKEIAPADYDQRLAAKDPKLNLSISKNEDIANIKTRAQYAKVYLVRGDSGLKYVILPVHGYGLWSTLYGFLALEGDGSTIYGLQFYEHAETPGLGGEVDNPNWRGLWRGKSAFDESGQVRIEVIRGKVSADDPDAQYAVDGLSGSTLTSRGVSNLLRYWLGANGFGPFLERLKTQDTNTKGA